MPPTEKEKSQKLQEKFQAVLSSLLREEENKYCVDCDAKGPRWASWNLGVFLCIRCAGIHRNLGVHISRVKSVNLDQWTAEQIASMQAMGNSKAREIYEKNLPDNFRRSQNDSAMEQFIRAKYEQKKWIAKDWTPSSNIHVSSDLKEIPNEKKKTSGKISFDSNILPAKDSSKSTKTDSPKSNNANSSSNGSLKPHTENSSDNNSSILLDFDTKETTPPISVPQGNVQIDFFDANFNQMNLNENNTNLIQNELNDSIFSTDLFSNAPTTNIINPTPTSPTLENQNHSANNITNNSDFNTLFISSPTIDNSSKKIDKNSILALYGQAKPPTTMGIPQQQQQTPQMPGQTMIKSNSFYSTPMTVNSNQQASFAPANNQFFNHSTQPQQNNHIKANNFFSENQFSNLTTASKSNANSLLDDFFGSSKPSGLF